MSKPPHFVIVGAPKAGTTSLYHYLQQHPKIFMPENKEPRYFCGPLSDVFEYGKKHMDSGLVSTEDEYLALFRNAPPEVICGEASTDYLCSPMSANNIHAWNPSAKIIIMLRNPVDRAYSEYEHSVGANLETSTFWESLCLEDERIKLFHNPIYWHVRRGLYFEGVKKYLELFGKDKVRIIFFEEFAKSTATVVESLFEYLGVPSQPVNVNKRYNSRREWVPHALNRVFSSRWVQPVIRFVEKIIGQRRMQDVLNRLPPQKKENVRDILSKEQFEWLQGKFREDILKLQYLLGVNLDHWI